MSTISVQEIINILNNRNGNGNHIASRKLYFVSKNGNRYRITNYVGKRGHNHCFEIEFLDTGSRYIRDIYDILSGAVRDTASGTYLSRFAYGYNYNDYRNADPILVKSLKKRWQNMLMRCYYDKHKAYINYGANGVTVCDRWKTFTNYYDDVTSLPSFDRELVISNKLVLDKDMSDMKIYSKDTCTWMTQKENINLIDFSKRDKTNNYASIIDTQGSRFIVTYPDGHTEICLNASQFAREHDLNQSKISACLLGKRKSHKGFTFKSLSKEEYNLLTK